MCKVYFPGAKLYILQHVFYLHQLQQTYNAIVIIKDRPSLLVSCFFIVSPVRVS